MELLVVTDSMLQIAALGLALAQLLHGLSDEESPSTEEVKELALIVKSTSLVFEEIGKVFRDEGSTATPMISQNAIATVQEIAANFTATLDDLESKITDAEESAEGLPRLTSDPTRIKVHELALWQMQCTLQCILQVIVYARMKAQPDSVFNNSQQRKLLKNLIREQAMAAGEYRQVNAQAEILTDNEVLPFPQIPAQAQSDTDLAVMRAQYLPRRSHADKPAMSVDSEAESESDVDRLVRKCTTLYP
ncbi:hypothetical protein BJY00DRAFT_279227 [Aspergillus carlsbadensis]|nr:hypothetical protein BJY00DRAFT_279227 [Aspergillus carlsbadensis]